MMVGGWFDLALICRGSLFGLRYGRYFSVTRLKVMSRKLVSARFVYMVIFNPSFLNKAMIFFPCSIEYKTTAAINCCKAIISIKPNVSLPNKFDNLSKR